MECSLSSHRERPLNKIKSEIKFSLELLLKPHFLSYSRKTKGFPPPFHVASSLFRFPMSFSAYSGYAKMMIKFRTLFALTLVCHQMNEALMSKVTTSTIGYPISFICDSQDTPVWNRRLVNQNSRTIAIGNRRQSWFKDERLVFRYLNLCK